MRNTPPQNPPNNPPNNPPPPQNPPPVPNNPPPPPRNPPQPPPSTTPPTSSGGSRPLPPGFGGGSSSTYRPPSSPQPPRPPSNPPSTPTRPLPPNRELPPIGGTTVAQGGPKLYSNYPNIDTKKYLIPLIGVDKQYRDEKIEKILDIIAQNVGEDKLKSTEIFFSNDAENSKSNGGVIGINPDSGTEKEIADKIIKIIQNP